LSREYKNAYDQLFCGNTENLYKKIKTCFLLSTNLKVETTLLNTKLRLKYNKNAFSTIGAGSFYKSNYPIKFINLSTANIINLFEGKFTNSSKIVMNSNALLVIGNAFKKKITAFTNLICLFKKVCPTGLIIDNQIYPNSVGFNLLGINGLVKKAVKSTEYFFCINLEDNTQIRKLLFNREFFWFNTHGSSIAVNARFILPTLTFFEVESMYLNLDGTKKKSQRILPCLKDSQSVLNILKSIKNIVQSEVDGLGELSKSKSQSLINTINYVSQLKFKPSLFFKDKQFDFVFRYPNKNIMENFFGDSTITKNSVILSKRSQEQQKSSPLCFYWDI